MIRKSTLAAAAVVFTAMQVQAGPWHHRHHGPRFGLVIAPPAPPPVVVAPPVYPYPVYGYPVYPPPVYPPPAYAPVGFGLQTRNLSLFFGR